MKSALLSILFGAGPLLATAQTANLDWAYTLNSTETGSGSKIQTDDSGNVYISGSFSGSADFDPGPGNTTISSQPNGIFLQKLDAQGHLLWVRSLENDFWKTVTAMHVTANGDVYLGGNYQQTMDLDPGNQQYIINGAGCYLLQLDPNGNFVWGGKIGGFSETAVMGIDTDQNGNVFVGGYFEGQADFDPGTEVVNLNAIGDLDSYILKLAPGGSFVWVKRIGGADFDLIRSMDIDTQGNILMAGTFQGNVDFNPSSFSDFLHATETDAFVLKFDNDGNFVFVRAFTGEIGEIAQHIVTAGDGTIYVSGYSNSGVTDFAPGTGTLEIPIVGYNDLFVARLSAGGDVVWVKTFGQPGGTIGSMDLELTFEGHILLCGSHTNGFDADPGPGIIQIEETGGDYVLLLHPSGSYIWGQTLDSDVLAIFSITTDASGNLYTTGHMTGTADLDPGAPTASYSCAGSMDAFVTKQYFVLGLSNQAFGIQRVYPNPFTENATIVLEKPVNDAILEVVGINGQMIRSASGISGKELTLDRSDLAAGFYLIRITEDHQLVAAERIVITD